MKVLFFTKYDRLAANTRYRCLQYLPYLEKAGIRCSVSPLLDDGYLKFKFHKGYYPIAPVLKAYFKRLLVLFKIRKFDLVVLHYELFPYFPAVFETLLSWLGVDYVFDFDDAIYHQYDVHPNPVIRFLLKRKINKVIKHSKAVLAGNSYLAQYAQQNSKCTVVVPTVVDPEYYIAGQADRSVRKNRPFTIGWIGSPSTVAYVRERSEALRRFCSKYDARLVLVGSGQIDLPGVLTVIREWSEKTEIAELKGFDIGIMPLTDDPWSRGKCGFKLIQYMASGLPVVASPVGVNRELVEQGKSGFLASTDDEWVEALETLYHNFELRSEMGKRGLEKVLKGYNLPLYAPKVAEVLWGAINQDRRITLLENVDQTVARDFGDEWLAFPQIELPRVELQKIFNEYFSIFPWNRINAETSVGADIGCGSGRWAVFVAPKVKKLLCLDASAAALEVAQKNLAFSKNVEYVHANIGQLPFEDNSLDFAYSIGVLHHIPSPQRGIQEVVNKLKPGAPFLVYIYYAFDNRGFGYKVLWRLSDFARKGISRLPFHMKYWISQLLAIVIYWPLARFANVLARAKILPKSWTLSYYRDKAFYVMRTDALDRFGTRLEQRFTKEQIQTMLEKSGLKDIKFSESAPYWIAVGIKA